MIAKRIVGANNVLGPPKGWDPSRNGPCGHLHVRVSAAGGALRCESAWEPTPEELRILNAGGHVILSVVGGQPPVALYVEPPGDVSAPEPESTPMDPKGDGSFKGADEQ